MKAEDFKQWQDNEDSPRRMERQLKQEESQQGKANSNDIEIKQLDQENQSQLLPIDDENIITKETLKREAILRCKVARKTQSFELPNKEKKESKNGGDVTTSIP